MQNRALFLFLSASTLIFFACAQQSPNNGAPVSGPNQAANAGQRSSQNQGQGVRRSNTIIVQAMTAHVEALSAERVTSGVVTPITQSQVAAQGSGIVLKVLKQSGTWVSTGDVIIQLDDAQQRLTLATARANYENAKINLSIGQDTSSQANPKLDLQVQSAQSALDSAQKNYETQKALLAVGGTSASAVDTSLSALKQAQANLAAATTALDQNRNAGTQSLAQLKLTVDQALNQVTQAQLNLQNMSVRAPFSGQISAILVSPGMFVGANSAAFTLVSNEKQISFNIAPSEGPAIISASNLIFVYNGKNYPIRLGVLPSSPINGMIPLTGTLPNGAKLPYGGIGTISYQVKLATGVVVPIGALESLENQIFVFTIVDGKVINRFVNVIAETGDQAAVSGIEGGTIVIVNAPPGLIENSAVQAQMLDQLGVTKPNDQAKQITGQNRRSADQSANSAQASNLPGKKTWQRKTNTESAQTENK